MRWFQAVRVAGYPTRYELECAEWERQPANKQTFDDSITMRLVCYWYLPPGFRRRRLT